MNETYLTVFDIQIGHLYVMVKSLNFYMGVGV